MAQAYAVVMVEVGLFTHDRMGCLQMAQREADRQFEELAIGARKTLVTRDPEPRIMSHQEKVDMLPNVDVRGVVGLWFTADIA